MLIDPVSSGRCGASFVVGVISLRNIWLDPLSCNLPPCWIWLAGGSFWLGHLQRRCLSVCQDGYSSGGLDLSRQRSSNGSSSSVCHHGGGMDSRWGGRSQGYKSDDCFICDFCRLDWRLGHIVLPVPPWHTLPISLSLLRPFIAINKADSGFVSFKKHAKLSHFPNVCIIATRVVGGDTANLISSIQLLKLCVLIHVWYSQLHQFFRIKIMWFGQ